MTYIDFIQMPLDVARWSHVLESPTALDMCCRAR
jgi:hypothetical protein